MKIFLLVLCCLAGANAGPEFISDEKLMTLFTNLMPLFEALEEKMEEHTAIDDETSGAVCVGFNDFGMKLMGAMEECDGGSFGLSRMDEECVAAMEAIECVLTSIEWLTVTEEDCSINYDIISEDIAMSNLGEELDGSVELCQAMADMITPECLEEIMSGDLDVEAVLAKIEAFFEAALGGEEGEEPEERQDEEDPLLEFVQGLAFFGCLHMTYECACSDAINEILLQAATYINM